MGCNATIMIPLYNNLPSPLGSKERPLPLDKYVPSTLELRVTTIPSTTPTHILLVIQITVNYHKGLYIRRVYRQLKRYLSSSFIYLSFYYANIQDAKNSVVSCNSKDKNITDLLQFIRCLPVCDKDSINTLDWCHDLLD